jgi:hypothetical protein
MRELRYYGVRNRVGAISGCAGAAPTLPSFVRSSPFFLLGLYARATDVDNELSGSRLLL